MRCLSVADALTSLGADVSFILSDSNSVELIESGASRRSYSILIGDISRMGPTIFVAYATVPRFQ